MTFEAWMSKVNGWVEMLTGVTTSDLADWGYRDAYESEVSPKEAALAAIESGI